MFGRQPDAQLEQGLTAPFLQLIKNDASRRVRKSLEDIAHQQTIGKSLLACQGRWRRLESWWRLRSLYHKVVRHANKRVVSTPLT